MRIRDEVGYTFDDVLLVPQHSTIQSRINVDTSVKLGQHIHLGLPILSANMDTVTEAKMAIAMAKCGCAGVLHRFTDSGTMYEWCKEIRQQKKRLPLILSAGLDLTLGQFYHQIDYEFELDGICIDIAHGDNDRAVEAVKMLRKLTSRADIIAGNITTGSAAERLIGAGANILKIGVGPGSLCSTRVVTGHGVPQLTAIMDIKWAVDRYHRNNPDMPKVSLIADGGIRTPGDVVKAIAAGADAVMLGSLLAGTEESPGDIIMQDGQAFKGYRGMASYEIQKEKRADKAPQVEGVSARVPYRGLVAPTIQNLENGLRSGMSYSNARTIDELQKNAEFIIVTPNCMKENSPHHPWRLTSS